MQHNMGITFHQGVPSMRCDEAFPPEQRPSLLVLDDLMRETADSDQVMDIYSARGLTTSIFL